MEVAKKCAEFAMSMMQRVDVLVPKAYLGKIIGSKGSNLKVLKGNHEAMRVSCIDQDFMLYSQNPGSPPGHFGVISMFGPAQEITKSTERLIYQLIDIFDPEKNPDVGAAVAMEIGWILRQKNLAMMSQKRFTKLSIYFYFCFFCEVNLMVLNFDFVIYERTKRRKCR